MVETVDPLGTGMRILAGGRMGWRPMWRRRSRLPALRRDLAGGIALGEHLDRRPVGGLLDINGNGVPDECDEDCNGNGVPDDEDLANGASGDRNGNMVPDECEPDCNHNGLPDGLDIEQGRAADCNGNGVSA